jgi:hypothetical protein
VLIVEDFPVSLVADLSQLLRRESWKNAIGRRNNAEYFMIIIAGNVVREIIERGNRMQSIRLGVIQLLGVSIFG